MKIGQILNVKVYRFDPSVDKEAYYKDYKLPFQFEKMKVLDVIRYIQEKIDGSLSFTWDCRLWNCGLCGVSVNKKPCSSCYVDVKSIAIENSLLIEPLPHYPVIKDLVIDRTVEIEELCKKGIRYERPEIPLENIPETMDPEEIAFVRDWFLACIDCLACSAACPVFSTDYEFAGPHLNVRTAKYASHPKDEGNRAGQAYEGGLFKCLNCGRCNIVCPLDLNIASNTMEMLKSKAIENGFTPPLVRDFLENIYKVGNPWGMSPYNRAKWAEGTEVELFDHQKHEYLLFVGCTGSYDTRAQKVTKSLAKLLLKAGVSFGILGEEEICEGNEVARMGEKGLFEELAEKNIKLFKAKKIKKIVTLSPHAYNALKNEYPEHGGQYEVVHYTQLLRDLLKANKLKIREDFKGKVTFHDSCFLGRYNGEYDAPREILQEVSGLELVEMGRIKENSFCCGGGGGNFFTGLADGKVRPSGERIKEAHATGANMLAVSCPICITMFEDAVKAENLEEKIVVKDISEILLEALQES